MRRFLRERGPAIATALAVAALATWAAWVRARFLFSSPYPWGIDGYWYAVQARSILELGRPAYPTAPLAPWLVALVAHLSDPIVATKLVAAGGGALAVVPAYLLGRRLGGGRASGLLAAALVATGAGSFYLVTEFVKEGLGVTLALAFTEALAWGVAGRGRARAALPAALLVLCALTHKTSAGLAVVFGLPIVVAAAWQSGRRRLLAVGAGLVVLLLVLGALAPRRFLGLGDLRLLGGAFRGDADWTLAPLVRGDGSRLMLQGEVAIAALLALLALVARRLPRLRERFAPGPEPLGFLVFGFLVFALVIAVPWLDARDPDGLPFRLRLLAFVPLAIVAAWLARPLPRIVPLVAAVALLALRPVSTSGIVGVHPGLALVMRSFSGVLPEGSVVITPERQIAFMAEWYARVDARTRPLADGESVSPAHLYRLLPQAAVRPELAALLDDPRTRLAGPPPRELHYIPHGLVLVREDVFQALLQRLPAPARDFYLSWPTR